MQACAGQCRRSAGMCRNNFSYEVAGNLHLKPHYFVVALVTCACMMPLGECLN